MHSTAPPMILYVVVWRERGIFKVGRANHMGRVRKHLATGATALVLVRDRTTVDEARALTAIARRYPRAFDTWREARKILGPAGSGYSECYQVAPQEIDLAVDLVLGALANG